MGQTSVLERRNVPRRAEGACPTLSRRPAMTVVCTLDPLGPKIGGSGTFIRGLLQHAPPELDVRCIGVTCDARQRPPMQWSSQQLGGRRFEFLPVLYEPREDHRHLVPLSLRFVRSLRAGLIPEDGAVLVHNRIETLCAHGVPRHRNIAFVHNDVPAQIGSGATEVLWSRFPWLYYPFERYVFGFADRVYTVSSNTLNDCRRRYPDAPEKFAFMSTWVDLSRFVPLNEPVQVARRRLVTLDIEAGAQWILYVGRLQPQKAPQRLLDAFARLHREWKDAHLILIGEGDLRSAVESQIRRLGLTGHVHLLGSVPQHELPAYYRAADVLLLGSDFEGMPMCVLEALACGLPVVTTRVGEVARVVLPGTTGEISEQRSAEGVCGALGRALDRLARHDRAACRAAVMSFSPRQVLAPIYAEVGELARREDTAN